MCTNCNGTKAPASGSTLLNNSIGPEKLKLPSGPVRPLLGRDPVTRDYMEYFMQQSAAQVAIPVADYAAIVDTELPEAPTQYMAENELSTTEGNYPDGQYTLYPDGKIKHSSTGTTYRSAL